jgi:Ala-tRNA(Pro) deacylase
LQEPHTPREEVFLHGDARLVKLGLALIGGRSLATRHPVAFEFLVWAAMHESLSVFARLTALLDAHAAAYEVLEHAPVYTSEEAARVRGSTLASGAKALICKVDDHFAMFVLPADRRLDSKRVRAALGAKGLRFATREEVLERTGLTPGSIPPFGQLFQLPTWCDAALAAEPSINFNAGDHARSIRLAFAEFQRVEQPRLAQFAS